MDLLRPYLGDLNEALPPAAVGVIVVLIAAVCGTLVGWERQARDKPAGMRTMMLICVGSAVFTVTSLVVGDSFYADRGRIAAQVVTGIGFLGAGAIIRDRGRITGLTTGATIWCVAAIGVLIGAGHALAGVALTLLVVGILMLFRRGETPGGPAVKSEE